MSEEQTATATITRATQSEPDTSEPTSVRQAELRAAYEANVTAGKAPYQRVQIRTPGELKCILRERDWAGGTLLLPAGKPRPDLREARFVGADLRGAYFAGADLREANFGAADQSTSSLGERVESGPLSREYGAKLGGADLTGADLRGASLGFADLSGTNLAGANLGGAYLAWANLSGSSLTGVHLGGATLSNAALGGASLIEARLDKDTQLASVKLDEKTRLRDIDWQGVPLTRVVAWPAHLGDEQDIATMKTRRDRIKAYRNTARSYRNLSIALRSQGLLIPASNYRLREQELERKASFLSGKLLGWAFSWLLYLVAGYGERPVRAFFAYLLVLFGFAGAYLVTTNGFLGFGAGATQVQPLQWYEALVLSVSAFHGRGFFQPVQSLGDPVAILAAIEAVIGLFIEITFIATFTQRFFGGR